MNLRVSPWGVAALVAGLLVALHARRAAMLAARLRASFALPVFEGLVAASWVLLGISILAHSHALFWMGIVPAGAAAGWLVAVFLGGLFDPDWGVQVWLRSFYEIRGRRLGRPMPSNEEMVDEALRVALMTLGTILVGGVGVWLDLHTPIHPVPLAIVMLLGVAGVYLAVFRPWTPRR